MKKADKLLVALAVAAVFFSTGYFAGKAAGGDVEITVERGGGAPGTSVDTRVDINRADVQELMTLPGVGRTLAERIVEYRDRKGLFLSPGEIMEVEGVGQALYDKLADKITI